MESVPLQILCLVNKVIEIERRIGALRPDTVGSRYIIRKLSKYMRKAYLRLASVYDPKHFTRAQYEKDAEYAANSHDGMRMPGHKWMNLDLEARYRSKVARFFSLHTLDARESVRAIESKYRSNPHEEFLCAAEINRYLRFHMQLRGMRCRPRDLRTPAKATDMDSLYCTVCRRAIVRKMVGYHAKSAEHARRMRHFTGKDPIFDYSRRYGADIAAHTDRLRSRNRRMLSRIGKHHPRPHRARPDGAHRREVPIKVIATKVEASDFEEFEDDEGHVYDRRTYEDLANNRLL